jgi:hypothetical protein
LGLLWFTGCSVFGIRDTPEPPYKVVTQLGSVVVRQYGPRIVAETTVKGDEITARSRGFRTLAGYIFGANHTHAEVAMTAPVVQAPGRGTTTIDMTAPVVQQARAPDLWDIRFFMPANFTLATLPVPDDDTIRLTEQEPETYAVLRFSGFASAQVVQDKTMDLLAALKESDWTPTGAPVVWFYDPPWTLPPLRRNEVAVSVRTR